MSILGEMLGDQLTFTSISNQDDNKGGKSLHGEDAGDESKFETRPESTIANDVDEKFATTSCKAVKTTGGIEHEADLKRETSSNSVTNKDDRTDTCTDTINISSNDSSIDGTSNTSDLAGNLFNDEKEDSIEKLFHFSNKIRSRSEDNSVERKKANVNKCENSGFCKPTSSVTESEARKCFEEVNDIAGTSLLKIQPFLDAETFARMSKEVGPFPVVYIGPPKISDVLNCPAAVEKESKNPSFNEAESFFQKNFMKSTVDVVTVASAKQKDKTNFSSSSPPKLKQTLIDVSTDKIDFLKSQEIVKSSAITCGSAAIANSIGQSNVGCVSRTPMQRRIENPDVDKNYSIERVMNDFLNTSCSRPMHHTAPNLMLSYPTGFDSLPSMVSPKLHHYGPRTRFQPVCIAPPMQQFRYPIARFSFPPGLVKTPPITNSLFHRVYSWKTTVGKTVESKTAARFSHAPLLNNKQPKTLPTLTSRQSGTVVSSLRAPRMSIPYRPPIQVQQSPKPVLINVTTKRKLHTGANSGEPPKKSAKAPVPVVIPRDVPLSQTNEEKKSVEMRSDPVSQAKSSNPDVPPIIPASASASKVKVLSKPPENMKSGVLVRFEDDAQLWIDKLRDLMYLDDEPVKTWQLEKGTKVAAKFTDGLFYDAIVLTSYECSSTASKKKEKRTSQPESEKSKPSNKKSDALDDKAPTFPPKINGQVEKTPDRITSNVPTIKSSPSVLPRVHIKKLELREEDETWDASLIEMENQPEVPATKPKREALKVKCPYCFLVFKSVFLFRKHQKSVCGCKGVFVPDFEFDDGERVAVDESGVPPLVEAYKKRSDPSSTVPRDREGKRCFRRGTNILHRWQTDAGSKWYNGKILRLLVANKKAPCEFEVEYDDDDDQDSGPLRICLYEDYPHDVRVITR